MNGNERIIGHLYYLNWGFMFMKKGTRTLKQVLAFLLVTAIAMTSVTAADVSEDTDATAVDTDGGTIADDYDEMTQGDTDVDEPIDNTEVTDDTDETALPQGPRDFYNVLREYAGLQSEGVMKGTARHDLYQHYYAQHHEKARPQTPIVLNFAELLDEVNGVRPNPELDVMPQYKIAGYAGRRNLLIWGNDLGEFDFEFDVPATGVYHLQFKYHTVTAEEARTLFAVEHNWDENKSIGMNNAVELGFKLNDEYPFSSARALELDKYWKNEGIKDRQSRYFDTDARDHEIMPRQEQYHTWITQTVLDREGLFNEHLLFYLEKGKNKVTLCGIKVDGVAFESMTFMNAAELPAYVKPSESDLKNTPNLNGTILLEGEQPLWRTSTELGPTYDNTVAGLSPEDPVKMRYNIVGGNESWRRAGQGLTWEFDIPQDGYYCVSAKVRQNTLRGFSSNRRILVSSYDAAKDEWSIPQVPVKEFDAVQFPYAFNWQQQTLTTDNTNKKAEPVYLHFTKGLHRITFEVVPGAIGDSLIRLSDEVLRLNYYYRRILMITGPEPDEYNPYEIDKQIPELLEEFKRISKALRDEKDLIEGMSQSGSEAAALDTMAVILDKCVNNPDRIPARLQGLRDNISALSAWVRQAGRQPLQLDYVEILAYGDTPGPAKASFFEQITFLWRGFIGSFTEDFTKLGDAEEGKQEINVWVGLGRDQALTLKQLVDGEFNNKNEHDIWISINLVQGGILEASLAGKGPDVGLFIGGDFPIQLAARDLLVDLTQFDGYDKIVQERFATELPKIFSYMDGVYGLPLMQDFPMMFYREDILSDLGLEPPRDWDEYEDAVSVLQRAYLGMGLLPPTTPPPMGVVITVFEPGDTFAMLQSQTGQNFYRRNEQGIYSETTFDSVESIEAFNTWARFYTVYQFEQSYDPFSRFRTGEFPILIVPYTFFNMLNAAAPEIRGLWNFRHVPGSWRELNEGESGGTVVDGTGRFLDERVNPNTGNTEYLDIAATSGSNGGLIFSHLNATEQEAAWQFLVWLTSDDTQTQFGQNMEAMLGPLGRYNTANVNAMRNLAWSAVELNRLETQRDALVEIPMIPANYSVVRHIRNAFRAVVNDNAFPRFALETYNRDINSEIERKNDELERSKKK
ncbi:MAG: extracellular solute-binding protein [Oscillospiraceae bacterium]|nr:extracellular solute-binding protein [Oscillospiraceae bacterium]